MSNDKTERGASIATRTGDTGEGSLLFGGRVSKSHPQIECCGAIDELGAALGVARAACASGKIGNELMAVQKDLITVMGEIACAPEEVERYAQSEFPKLDADAVERLDAHVSRIEGKLPPLRGWAFPGSRADAAALEMARVVARRAERRLVGLRDENGFPLRPVILQYFNRVSDFLWLLARELETAEGDDAPVR